MDILVRPAIVGEQIGNITAVGIDMVAKYPDGKEAILSILALHEGYTLAETLIGYQRYRSK